MYASVIEFGRKRSSFGCHFWHARKPVSMKL